jgi:hypothetical protein
MSMGFKFIPQVFEVVDFSIEHHPYRFRVIRHGLVAPIKIDDRKTPKAEAKRTRHEEAIIIRASMG